MSSAAQDLPASGLSRAARRLLWAGVTVAMAGSLTGVFVSLFLFVSGGRLGAMAAYSLGMYVGIGATSVVLSGQRGRVGPGGLFRSGVLLTAVQYAALLALGDRADRFVLPLGLLAGIAGGIYWFAMNTYLYDLVGARERLLYYGSNQALTAAAGVALPLVGGLIISHLGAGGYDVVFAASGAGYLVALVIGRGLPPGHPVGGQPLGEAIRLLRERPRFARLWLAIGLRGMRDVSTGFVLVALAYLVTRSAGGLALSTSGAALAGALGGLVLRRAHGRRERWAMWLGAVAIAVFSVLLVPFGPSLGLFTAFLAATAFATPLYRIPVSARVLAIMDEDPAAVRTRGIYVLGQELAVNAGRLLAIGAVLALVRILPLWPALTVITAAIALCQVGAVALADVT